VIGIVLSGSASDGTEGIKDIKNEGGLTFAQDDTANLQACLILQLLQVQ
jgi:two-component system CheB/CheR fusion protein